MRYRIVETDNFGRDYPDESFLPVPAMPKAEAEAIAAIINRNTGPDAARYWKVVDTNYTLAPGFEP